MTAHLTQAGREGMAAVGVAAIGTAVIGMWWRDTPTGSLHSWADRLTSAGRLTGLLGTYLVLVEVLLLARITWLDRLIGMDRLATWHRRNGEYSIGLLVAHAILTIWGYGLTDHAGPLSETKTVVLSYPDMLAATVGLLLLVAVGAASARAARRRLRYQTWYFIHLYTYLAIALSFAHQLATGGDFATHPGNRVVWVALYVITGVLLLTYRVGIPARDAARHQLRVGGLVAEAPGVVSVYITGRDLGDLRAEAGQFFLWRSLTRDGWWQAHPYSLSAAPNPRWLRLTVKDLGDHSREIARLKPGTRVFAEGPYGSFTEGRRTRRLVLLIAGGIGITPVRALFEGLPGGPGDLVLVYRVSTPDDLVFRSELHELATTRGAAVHEVVGPRTDPDLLGPARLRQLVPDVAERDVYLCGPAGMSAAVQRTLHAVGVPGRRIHLEDFEY